MNGWIAASGNGFFPRSGRKSIGDPHMGGWGAVVRFMEAGANTKGCPQVSGDSFTARWLSSVCCGRSPAFVFTKPGRPGSRNSVPLAQHQQGSQSLCGSVQSRPQLSPAQALLPAVLRSALPCCAQACGCYEERAPANRPMNGRMLATEWGLCWTLIIWPQTWERASFLSN